MYASKLNAIVCVKTLFEFEILEMFRIQTEFY